MTVDLDELEEQIEGEEEYIGEDVIRALISELREKRKNANELFNRGVEAAARHVEEHATTSTCCRTKTNNMMAKLLATCIREYEKKNV